MTWRPRGWLLLLTGMCLVACQPGRALGTRSLQLQPRPPQELASAAAELGVAATDWATERLDDGGPRAPSVGEFEIPAMSYAQRQLGLPAIAPNTSFRFRGSPPDRLSIPSIGVDSRVVPIGTRIEGGKLVWETAAFAVGHHQGTANPGDIGNVVLSGHVNSIGEGAVFRRLPSVKIGDGVIVMSAGQSILYRVNEISVLLPTAIEVLDPTPVPTLTLITCVPDGVYSHRLVVRAEPV